MLTSWLIASVLGIGSTDFVDHCLISWTKVLRNLVGATTSTEVAGYFMPYDFIEVAEAPCFQGRADEKHVKRLGRDTFVERLAFHDEKINAGGSTSIIGKLFVV